MGRVIERLVLLRQGQQQSPLGTSAQVGSPTNLHAKKPRIYFIKFAMGSTSLHEDWCPDGPYFEDFTSFTKAMLRRVAELEDAVSWKRVGEALAIAQVDCMFWNQGDSDASGRAVMR